MDLSAFAGHKLMPNPVMMTKSCRCNPVLLANSVLMTKHVHVPPCACATLCNEGDYLADSSLTAR